MRSPLTKMANRLMPITRPAAASMRCTSRVFPSNFQLIPGMTLKADVNVGTRSVAMYLLDGVLRGFGEAMREP